MARSKPIALRARRIALGVAFAVAACGDADPPATEDPGIEINSIKPAANDPSVFRSPFDATPDPKGENVYFTALTVDGVPAIFASSANGGGVRILHQGAPLASPFSIATSEDGKTLYVADGNAEVGETAEKEGEEDGAIFTLGIGTSTTASGPRRTFPTSANPVVVRDAEAVGIYTALGVPPSTVEALKSNRLDIIETINIKDNPTPGAHTIPLSATGDVLRVDLGTDSSFPNGRPIPGPAPNKEQADVTDVLLSVILAKGTLAVGDGVNSNDKPYLTQFPYPALPWEGFSEGHGKAAPLRSCRPRGPARTTKIARSVRYQHEPAPDGDVPRVLRPVSSQARPCPGCGQPFGSLSTKWYQSYWGAALPLGILLILGLVGGGVALQYALEPAKPTFPAR